VQTKSVKNKQRPSKKRHGAIALLEFNTIAIGVLASDLMVKKSPIALLRCGTIHPGRYLILIGGSVASTQEAYAVGIQLGEREGALSGSVFLGDVHPYLHDAVLGVWPLWMPLSRVPRLNFPRFAWAMTWVDMRWLF